jgi:DNA-binding NarL/FixJ family response regulator
METVERRLITVTSRADPSTTVLIADPDPLVARGLAMIVSSAGDLDVVGTYVNGTEAVFEAQSSRPDVIVMDNRLLDLDGFATLRLLDTGCRQPAPKVVLVSTAEDEDAVMRAVTAGASGYVLKRTAHDDLVPAVRHVAAGHAWLDQQVVATVIDALVRTARAWHPIPMPAWVRLTPRELEVLVLMTEGLSNAEIGERLVVSEGTVKTHVSRVLMKIAARDRAQAIALAYRSGWVSMAS